MKILCALFLYADPLIEIAHFPFRALQVPRTLRGLIIVIGIFSIISIVLVIRIPTTIAVIGFLIIGIIIVI